MRNEKKYVILTLVSVLLGVLMFYNVFREYFRMEAAEARQHDEYVIKGARVYAENCAQCHGPRGEGVIGMPLNRKALQVDANSPAGKDVYAMVYETLRAGRKGNDQHFQWEKGPGDTWISYSTMPAWGKDNGGPLDEDYLRALALFIMKEDGSQWGIVGDSDLAPFPAADIAPDPKTKVIPLPDSAATDVNASAQALLRNIGKSQCLSCHTVGTKGGRIGPDLTRVGSWGVDQKFLEDWIKYSNVNPADKENPNAVPHNKRMPVYWSANRAGTRPQPNFTTQVVSEGPYYMPRFKDKLTDAEISIIAKYLMGLK